jgi:enoyl-CoA hydratase/carnithine racemase
LPEADTKGPPARVVIVEVGLPEPDKAQLAELAAALSQPRLISVAYAAGRVSPANAAVALACDFLVASPDSVWDQAAGEVATAARRRLPPAQAAVVVAGEGRLTGADLHRAGLVSDLSDEPERAADALAIELSAVPAGSLAGSKEMIDSAAASTLDAALALESELQIAALLSDDHRRIVKAQGAERLEDAPRSDPQT